MPWLSRKVSGLCSGRGTLTQNWQNRAQQSQFHDEAIQSRYDGQIAFFFLLALSARGERCTSSISSHTAILAAIIREELFTEHWAPTFPTESSKSGLTTTLSSSPIFVKIPRRAVLNIASIRKQTFWDTSIKAFSYGHLLSRYNPVTPQDLDTKRQELQITK